MSSSESDGDDAACEDIRRYFTKREWSELSQYEKRSLSSSKRNYEAMVKAGLDPRKPKFMRSDDETPAVSKSKATKQPSKQKRQPKVEREVVVGPSRASRRIRTHYYYEDADKENGSSGALDEDLLFCDECNNAWMGDCPVHGELNCISDVEVAAGDPDRDTRSAPSVLAVLLRPSFPAQQHDDQDEDEEEYDEDEQHAGGERPKMGVWTKARVRKRTRFGPYEGDITPIDRDGDPANLPNWMHHVRRLPRGDCAAPNLRPFQYAGRLYFRTLTDVAPGTELVVSFKPQAASGVDNPRLRCEHCDRCFECPLLRAQHQRSSAHCAAQARKQRRALVDVQRERLMRVRQQQLDECSPPFGDSGLRHGLRGRGCTAPTDAEALERFRDQIRLEWRKYHQNQEGEWLAQEDVDSGPYTCRKCGDQFSRTARLHAHMRDKHPFNAAGVCGCRDCVDKQVAAAPCFLESVAIPCSTCGASFPSSDDLRAHVLLAHVATKRFRCDACGDSFGRKAVLQDHVRVKHEGGSRVTVPLDQALPV